MGSRLNDPPKQTLPKQQTGPEQQTGPKQPIADLALPSGGEGGGCGWMWATVWGLAVAGVWVTAIVSATWAIGGKGLADRALTDFAMPLGTLWTFLLVVAVAAAVRRRWAFAAFVMLIWIALGLAGNRPLGGMVRQSVEYSSTSNPADTIDQSLDAVVLLGGYAWVNQFGVPELGGDGQRLLFTAQLWHAGKTRTIICTGSAHFGDQHPSKIGRELLVSIGVPTEAIFEVPGENTAEEMKSLKAFFADPPDEWIERTGADTMLPKRGSEALVRDAPSADRGEPNADEKGDRSIGLVTSAYHLPRALRLAETWGLSFVPLACQFSGSAESSFNPRDLIPAASGARSIATGLKARLAGLVGR